MPETFRISYPHVLGHEWSGTVVAVGDEVTGHAVGDRVIGHGDLGNNNWFGVTVDGAMAELFRVPASMCFAVPEGIAQDAAAVIEPLACVLAGLRKVPFLSAADVVTVHGLGAIGLSAVMLAAESGALVRAVDPSALRRQKALDLGATLAVDPTVDSVEQYGLANLVIEASGSPGAQAAAISGAAPRATVLMMGVSKPRDVPVSLGLIQQRDLRVFSSTGAPAEIWEAALRLVDRAQFDLMALVTTVTSFSDWQSAIQRAESPERDIKILLTPDVNATAVSH